MNNSYRIERLDEQIKDWINAGDLVGCTKLTDEEAEKFGVINNDNMYKVHTGTELVFYNQETVTLTRIEVDVDDELYNLYKTDDNNKYTVSDIICGIFNNRNNSKANLDIDVLNYNNNYKDIDVNGVEVIIDTEDVITAGSFTAPQSIVNHPSDIWIPYSREMELVDDEDSDNMMELLDMSGQECWLTAAEISKMLGLNFGYTVEHGYAEEEED